jgi:hypothetical protein
VPIAWISRGYFVPALPVPDIDPTTEPVARYAATTIYALAREEYAGRRPKRILDPGHATWKLFRGRLRWASFLELLLEDAAVSQPHPFRANAFLPSPSRIDVLPDELLQEWVVAASALDLAVSPDEYIAAQAKTLDVSTRGAKASLHRVKPHHKVLEAPGSGGQLTLHMLLTQPELNLRDSFTIACGAWSEQVLAGLAAVEQRGAGELPISLDPDLARSRTSTFDYVVGLDPQKGGRHDALALRRLFPRAEIVLV